MSHVRIQTGDTERIQALILDASLVPLTGKTDILVSVHRVSDGLTLDWDDDTFRAYGSCTTPAAQMSQVDATNYPGQYYLDLDTSAVTNPTSDDTYMVTVNQSPGTDAANVPQVGEIKVGAFVDDIDASISSRAAPGDAMDLIVDAVDSNTLAASAADEIRDAILADSTPFDGADIAAILADTSAIDARLPADPADESNQLAQHSATQAAIGALNDLSQAEAQAACTVALTSYDPPTKAELDAAESAIRGVDSDDLKTLSDQIDGLPAGVDAQLSGVHGSGSWETAAAGLTAQDVRDAMKLAPTGGAPAAGSVDEALDNIEADTAAMDARLPVDPADESNQLAQHSTTQAAIGALQDLSQAQAQAACTAALNAYDPPTKAELDTVESNIRGADSDDLKILSDQLDGLPGDVDAQLSATHGAGNWESAGAGLTAQQVRDAMKLAPTGGAPAAGSVDEALDNIETDTTAIDTRLPADPADESNQLAQHSATQAAIAALNDLSSSDVQAALTAQGYTSIRAGLLNSLSNLDATITSVLAAIAALNDLSAVDVKAQADQALIDYDPPTKAELDAVEAALLAEHTATQAAIAALNDPSAADIDTLLSTNHGSGGWETGATSLQNIRDAMMLNPSPGVPGADSIDQLLADNVERLIRALGLAHENAFMDNTVYDSYGSLTSARLRIFDSKTNVEAATDGGSETTGLIETYEIEAVYESEGRVGTYRMKKL